MQYLKAHSTWTKTKKILASSYHARRLQCAKICRAWIPTKSQHSWGRDLLPFYNNPPCCRHWGIEVRSLAFYLVHTWDWRARERGMLSSVLRRCWLGHRKDIRPVKNWTGEGRTWLSVWSEVQICIWSSWCCATSHCLLLQLNPDWVYLSRTGSPR